MYYIIPILIVIFCLLSSVLGWFYNPWSEKSPPKEPSTESATQSTTTTTQSTSLNPNTISETPTGNDPIKYARPPRKDGEINYTEATKVIIREVPGQCPNCPACKCQDCPPLSCPPCPDCVCPVSDEKIKSATEEIKYLKWMVRFLGALLRRENAVNRVMGEHCSGTFAMVPMVQKADHETQFVQAHIQKDNDMLNYFQEHFTEYSGIESKPYKEIL
jgi:hypothetical protein